MSQLPARQWLERLRTQALWPWVKRGATAVLLLLLAWLLASQARSMDWHQVRASLVHIAPASLLGALALALLSLTLYSTFDLLGRRYTGHPLRTRTVMRITFISYVFNLNLGALVGAVALRYRLYARAGLDYGVITQVMSLSLVTNWGGYLLLAGLVFVFQTPTLPASWGVDALGLQRLGGGLLAVPLLYGLLCAVAGPRRLCLRGHHLRLPAPGLAALQLAMGAANWLLMGGMLFMLLQQKMGFLTVTGVLLVAAMAGVIARMPAGLGVLEAVFVALLSHQLPAHELLAAVLAYRAIYYLGPLGVAALLYLKEEA